MREVIARRADGTEIQRVSVGLSRSGLNIAIATSDGDHIFISRSAWSDVLQAVAQEQLQREADATVANTLAPDVD